MNIRNRLTLRFILIVVFILLMASFLIYIFSADYREEAFYDRLQSKANITAKLLIEVEEIDGDLLTKIEKDNPANLPNEKIIIYDYQNTILFSTDHNNEIAVDSVLLDRIRIEDKVRFEQGNFEVLGFLFKGQYDRFAVVAAATDIYGYNKLKNLRTILFVVFIISIFVVSLSGWFYSGKALQPISKVVNKVDEISISSLDLRVDEGNGRDEIAQLAKTFNNMLNRLEDSFKLQKNFIASASHELRTPLTAIRGQLEVTLLNTRTEEEYQNRIHSVLDDIKNLSNLSNRLLLLAQTSSVGFRLNSTKFRLDEIIWQTRDELVKNNPNFVIHIDIDQGFDDESKLIIHGDEQLIKVAITNIIENGCKYSADHLININISPSDNGVELIFKDNGIGIPSTDLPNIFEPFYRAANTGSIKGHGIGLSMVYRIITQHRGSIDILSKEDEGTTILVTMPI
jgi:signal transduction histidine kinase